MATNKLHTSVDIDPRLDIMFRMQRELQERYNAGKRLQDFTPEERVEAIRINVLALTDELHEALGEVGWKPWASSTHINREAYVGELVDAWHFFMNLMLHVDMDPDELFWRYLDKNAKNHKRQDDGYDGVTGKCPGCHRDLKDRGVECYEDVPERYRYWCDGVKGWYNTNGYPA